MRYYKGIFDKVQSIFHGGEERTNGRVTVEPTWLLNATASAYGNSARGPFRWFQDVDDDGEEWEVPNIKSIKWDRSEGQDLASCTITLYNQWHEGNLVDPDLISELGRPGAFWPKRSSETNRWNQEITRGAYRKDGFWDPYFSWYNVLERFALIRTYEGYGGHSDTEYVSIDDNINNQNIVITGTWLVKNISAGSNGEIVLTCLDIGWLLLLQSCFPPTAPDEYYPPEYYPAGKSAFDAFFGPKPKTGVSPASRGRVRALPYAGSGDADTSVNGTYPLSGAVDGSWATSALSDAYASTDDGTVYFEFDINQGIDSLSQKAWAGGYNCYVSLMVSGSWTGSETVPGSGIGYVKKINVPMAAPDRLEPVINIALDSLITVERVRLSFTHLYYSAIPDGSGNMYRAGIRDLVFYREGAKVTTFDPDFSTLPWTFAMTKHPTRGYWVADTDGNIYGFGDAADYVFDQVPVAEVHADNHIVSMVSHPDGKGYWVLDRVGKVYAYGSASHYGEFEVAWPGSEIWGADGLQAWDIAATHTGEGYWVMYGWGQVLGFGDATPDDVTLPSNDVTNFMNTYVSPYWFIQHAGNGIAAHPSKMGFWAMTGSGDVYAYGDCVHYGQLDQRVYNRGMADEFRLMKTEWSKSIESTVTGNGYWIAFGSGHIAAFGDAIGQGPTYIYPHNPELDLTIEEVNINDFSFFRALLWDIARDPDGTGFWVLVADGHIGSYNAEFWGNPGLQGLTGYRWHEGNYDGEYSSIIKELLLWSGWLLYNDEITSQDPPEVFGALESTGIKSDNVIPADKFDKRPILEIIKELAEVVAYRFRIQEDGSVSLASPNIWSAGNFDLDGNRIYVDGNGDPAEPEDEGAELFIPVIDEYIDLFEYGVTLDSADMRSEIIIGSDIPSAKDATLTEYVRHTPRRSTEEVRPDVPLMRNIPIVAIWQNQMFSNPEERELMAELISLIAWFSERAGNGTCVANPCISLGDQVRFMERNTRESFIHYVSGINSDNDLDTGEWTMTLTTHWLGDQDNWVITSSNVYEPVDGDHAYEISERVNRWAHDTGRNLEKADGSSEQVNLLASGAFSTSAQDSDTNWSFEGELILNSRTDNLTITKIAMTDPLGTGGYLSIYEDEDLIINMPLGILNEVKAIPILGHDNETTTFTYTITGSPVSHGNGALRLKFAITDTEQLQFVSDTLVLTRPS